MFLARKGILRIGAGVIAAGSLLAGAMLLGAARPRDVAGLYAEHCANCHGPALEGAQFGSLVDDAWEFGGDDAAIAHSIRAGHPERGMPPMGGATLSEQEIRGLVIHIREQAARRAGGRPRAEPDAGGIFASELERFRVETVSEDAVAPWGIDFLPDGRALVTEKGGALRVLDAGRLSPPVPGTPEVWAQGQGGMLDVGVHPDYARNGWIYLSYSDPGPGGSAMTAVVRGRLRDDRFTDVQAIFAAPEDLYRRGGVHFGSRFVFDGDGHVFFGIGERGQGADAQDLARPNGKVHRLHDDGRVPADNPFVGREGALGSIYSYGHRNPQGLDRHPLTGALWDVEHGPRGGDELNRLQPGANYGWPVITYGMNYNGTPMAAGTAAEGMQQPATYWVPSIAVSSLAFYDGDAFPRWRHQAFVGALAHQELRRLQLDGDTVVHQEVLLKDKGRVRDVVVGPDGAIYVVFNQPDRIARLVPAAAP
jgi:glucose/arabinose dehydrogenase